MIEFPFPYKPKPKPKWKKRKEKKERRGEEPNTNKRQSKDHFNTRKPEKVHSVFETKYLKFLMNKNSAAHMLKSSC